MPAAHPFDLAELRALYEAHVRRAPWLPDSYRVERVPPVVRLVGPGPHHLDNGVIWSGLSTQDADATIQREVEYFRSMGRAMVWNAYGHDAPGDLEQRLVAAGFGLQARETVLVARAADLRRQPSLPSGAALERVLAPREVDEVMQVQEEVWGSQLSTWLRASLLRDLREVGSHAIFLVRVGSEPAASAWVVAPPASPFAHLFGGTVVARHRRRGLFGALLAARAGAAVELGARWLVTDANENSRPVLERAGFVALATRAELVYGADVPGQPLTPM